MIEDVGWTHVGPANCFRSRDSETSGEYREPPEDGLFLLIEQGVAPVERRA